MNLQRGDIILINLEPKKGHEQGNIRPALVIQNNILNVHSPLTIILPITSKIYTKEYPTNIFLPKKISKLPKDSTILSNQIRAIDKSRILKKISSLDKTIMKKVEKALKISVGIS